MATKVPASTSSTGIIPSGAVRSQITDAIAAFGHQDASDPQVAATIHRALQSGIAKINRHTWKKLWSQTTITLVADDATYTLPTDFKEPISLLQLNSDSERDGRIPFKPHQSLVAENPHSTTSGTPFYYTIDYSQRELVLDVPPNASFVAKHPTLLSIYHRRVPYLDQDSTTTGLPPEFDDWLELYGMERLAQIQDPEKINYIRSEQRTAWRELRRDDNEIQTDWSDW